MLGAKAAVILDEAERVVRHIEGLGVWVSRKRQERPEEGTPDELNAWVRAAQAL